jgi:hypothetical protein
MGTPNRAEIEAQIAGLQAELAASKGGVYHDPGTGRWFVAMQATRGQALIGEASGRPAAVGVEPIGSERFES